jgi:hypothetical protein
MEYKKFFFNRIFFYLCMAFFGKPELPEDTLPGGVITIIFIFIK